MIVRNIVLFGLLTVGGRRGDTGSMRTTNKIYFKFVPLQ